MAKKDKGKQREQQLIEQVSESANDIWLAGLAAFEKAQREGSKVFSKLVKEGEKVESRTVEVAGNQLGDIRTRASGTWDKLENLFEARVQRALNSLGVPTGNEIRNLAKKVDNLGKSVKSVGKRKASTATKEKPKTRAKKAAPAAKPKTAAKRTAAAAKPKTTTKRTAAAKPKTAAKRTTAAAKPKTTTKRTAAAAKPKTTTTKRATAAAKPRTAAKRAAPAAKARATTRRSTASAKPRATTRRATGAAKTRASAARAVAPRAAAQGPDDLRAIGGIGPALERKLKDYGVSSYRQIAGWTSKEIEDIESKIIRISGRVTRDRWVAQAKAAHQKKYGK